MEDIKIIVLGETNSGKTSIVSLINDALKKEGINTECVDRDGDLDIGDERTLKRLEANKERIGTVTISEIQTNSPLYNGNHGPQRIRFTIPVGNGVKKWWQFWKLDKKEIESIVKEYKKDIFIPVE